MHRYETIDLGTYRGEEYFLVGFVDPEPTGRYDPAVDAERYGVSVAKSSDRPVEGNVEIVKMDTAHGQPHLDREYLPPAANEERKVWLEDGYSYRRMKRYLLANWKTYADRHAKCEE